MRWSYFIENQCIFLTSRKDLGVGWRGLENPYGVRILNPLEIIGRSLTVTGFLDHVIFRTNYNVRQS